MAPSDEFPRFHAVDDGRCVVDALGRKLLHVLFHLRCQQAKSIHAYACLLEKRGDFRQHLVHDGFWQSIHLAGVTGSQVDHARLIATDDADGLDAGHGHGEAQAAGELAAVGDRENHRQLGGLIEFGRRYDQDGTATALLMPCGWIERHQINVAPPHSSSPPTADASTHSRSSAGCGCE